MGKTCPSLSARCGGVSRLMVTPRVSGLERSQEKSLEPHFPDPVSSTSSVYLPRRSSHSPGAASSAVPRPSPMNGNSTRHSSSPPLSKPKPFLTLPPRSHPIYSRSVSLIYQHQGDCVQGLMVFFLYFFFLRSNTPAKPPSSASSVASSSVRPPTPSTSVSLPYNRGSGSSGPLRPPSRANSGPFFTSSPGLPPPPPLLPPANSTAAGTENRHSLTVSVC